MILGRDVSCRLTSMFSVELSIRVARDSMTIAFVPFAWTLYFSWNTYPGMAYIHVGPVCVSVLSVRDPHP